MKYKDQFSKDPSIYLLVKENKGGLYPSLFAQFIGLCLVLFLSFTAFSCQKESEKVIEEKKLKVVTSLFPLYDFAKNIGGQKADVTLLLPPGVEPHSFEPRPGDVLKLHDADIFIYTGRDMEPWVEDILKSLGSQGPLIVNASKHIAFIEEDFEKEHK